MPECILSDCKSGRAKSEDEKVQVFHFPTETTARNRWLRHCDLGKNIRKDPRLCAKHFLPSCFLKPSENVDDQGRPRSLLRLRDGAVPTVFNFGPTKRRARKHATTEVTPVPRKIPRIDHSYGVSSTVVNSENRYVVNLANWTQNAGIPSLVGRFLEEEYNGAKPFPFFESFSLNFNQRVTNRFGHSFWSDPNHFG